MKHLFHIHTISLNPISLKKSPWFRLTLNCILIFSAPRVLCKTSSSPELETPPSPFYHQNYSEIYIIFFLLQHFSFFLLHYYKSWAQIFLPIFEKCWEVFKRTFIEDFFKSQEILATWPFLIFKPTISFDSKLLIRALS